MQKSFILTLSAIALTACAKTIPPIEPVTMTAGTVPAGYASSYDSATDTVTVTIAGVDHVLARSPATDGKGFRMFDDTQIFVGYRETDTGSGYAAWGGSGPADSNFLGIEYGRLTQTNIPLSGNAAYTGGYTGLISFDLTPVVIIYGDAAVNADFGTSMVSGVINNRIIQGGQPFNDLVLEASAISSGAFSGATSGGASTAAGDSANPGIYFGLFTGSNGGEVVGGVNLTHMISMTGYAEAGAFVAHD